MDTRRNAGNLSGCKPLAGGGQESDTPLSFTVDSASFTVSIVVSNPPGASWWRVTEADDKKYNYYSDVFIHTRTAAGTMTVELVNTDQIADKITSLTLPAANDMGGTWSGLQLDRLTNLENLYVEGSTAKNWLVTGDITEYEMPASMKRLRLYNVQNLTGDLTDWVMPDGLVEFAIRHAVLLTGVVTNWVIPDGLQWFDIHDSKMSGNMTGWEWPNSIQYLWFWSMIADDLVADLSTWTLPTSLIELRLGGTSTNFTGDISGWVLPATCTYFLVAATSVTGDISDWVIPAGVTIWDVSSTDITGAPSFAAGNLACYQYKCENCGLLQANVDAIIAEIYSRRANFNSSSALILSIGGTNAAPSGTYQDATPPTTGKEMIYKLVNDPDAEGFKKWSITYTA